MFTARKTCVKRTLNAWIGNKLTTADLAVYNLLTQFNKIQDHSAKLKAHFEMVGKRKNIKEYVAKRPQTEF